MSVLNFRTDSLPRGRLFDANGGGELAPFLGHSSGQNVSGAATNDSTSWTASPVAFSTNSPRASRLIWTMRPVSMSHSRTYSHSMPIDDSILRRGLREAEASAEAFETEYDFADSRLSLRPSVFMSDEDKTLLGQFDALNDAFRNLLVQMCKTWPPKHFSSTTFEHSA